MKSVLQQEKVCYLCGRPYNLHDHHIFFGTSNRKNSEKYGLKVWLCADCHEFSSHAVHRCRETDLFLKQTAQKFFEEHIGTREEFREIFGKSWR